jgi:hypothetical protein
VDCRKRCERWKEKFSKVNTVQLLFYQRYRRRNAEREKGRLDISSPVGGGAVYKTFSIAIYIP